MGIYGSIAKVDPFAGMIVGAVLCGLCVIGLTLGLLCHYCDNSDNAVAPARNDGGGLVVMEMGGQQQPNDHLHIQRMSPINRCVLHAQDRQRAPVVHNRQMEPVDLIKNYS